MSKDKLRLISYLQHILESIIRIDEYVDDIDEVGFLNSHLIQDAVIRNLEVVGEASHNIEKHFPSFCDKHPEIPLSSAYQMRNAIAHGYFKVDYEIVWNTIESYLPELYQQIDTVKLYYLENDFNE
jgi:uncharacterized protein with HEPN domain